MAFKPNFHTDLAKGKLGESAFIALALKTAGIVLTASDGRKGDMTDVDGHKWELKSDQYDHDATGNFFIEQYSDIDKGKLGGPAQAQMHGCKFFVYYFAKNNIAYVFETDNLIEQLKSIDWGKPIQIRNVRWTSVGYKIARSMLQPKLVIRG